ncbi:MAG: orotidine-5'-phosphate decarboxylase [Bacteriovoracaceae bacterium]|jgi:orotidine-5'-phosphate decarboxylase|nr:orotidine-5'-phosphate decarboxylase [Bacteriovoracaceae bacterium]
MINKTIVALDNMSFKEAKVFLDKADGIKLIKIGMEMFYAMGKKSVLELSEQYNVKVFLDLKLHDIPNTVANAIKSLQGLPIEFLTIHAVGGREMINAAMMAKQEFLPDTNILGVSFLTSLSEDHFKEILNIEVDSISNAFKRVFLAGLNENIDGFILSGHELSLLNKLCKSENKQTLKICPGIRFKEEILSGNVQDQKRVMDPKRAFDSGADYIVMGRSLTNAIDLNSRLEELKKTSVVN